MIRRIRSEQNLCQLLKRQFYQGVVDVAQTLARVVFSEGAGCAVQKWCGAAALSAPSGIMLVH
ncbi:hypothetical protein ADINL_0811 [Nitrincola lacisaponensis]|uniref:Uncharacterized protein n=1 Tax=Nitrincola lacisaponensis TaxID=267850 RepID=A0A063Y3F2_9GAMM|nr:hypothetical protein ADINL_0811 [Nitrincola lacisaponensis]